MSWPKTVDVLSYGLKRLTTGDHSYTLFTDASLTGFGAVLLRDADGFIDTYAGKWNKSYSSGDINVLEMKALASAAAHWPILSQASSLSVVMDNTSCTSTLKKGSAYSWSLNKALRDALRLLPADVPITIGYITSTLNPADALSRGFHFSAAAPLPAMGLGGCWGSARVRVAGSCPHRKY
jgi:hypothetical protein